MLGYKCKDMIIPYFMQVMPHRNLVLLSMDKELIVAILLYIVCLKLFALGYKYNIYLL